MLYSLKLENANNQIVDLNDNVNYVVLDCKGLNPPKADLFTSTSPNRKGSRYNGSSLNERSIELTIKLLGDVEASRNALYEFLDSELYTKIYYENNIKQVYCEGYVEEHEFDLFTSNELVNVSITCCDPYLKSIQTIQLDISSLLHQFTFPFSIDNVGIPFSTIKENNETSFYNQGSETGFKIQVVFKNTITKLEIYNVLNKNELMTINHTFNKGEVLVIDTDKSPKTITLIKSLDESENILKDLTETSTWLKLKKGANKFGYRVNIEENEEDVDVDFIFNIKYLGV